MLLPAGWFPFVIPWDDALRGTATDVSFLNVAPAGKNGRIVVKGGHFVEANTGRRVRFMGTNLTALSAFPSHADADKIAGRLAKAGFNIVRFHHLQNAWDLENGGSIWKKGRAMIEVDPAQLDKLDYFVYALKKHGVYTNLNLQTTRDYVPELGFPEEVRQLKDFAKKIDKVDRRMIALQKEYAKRLLDRKNPYTGLAYRDEPALAVVEINNENSLVGWPGEAPGAGLTELPPYFRGEVETAWNAWLRKTYADAAALTKAWAEGVTPAGPSLVRLTRPWSQENQSGGDVRPVATEGVAAEDEAPAIALDIRSNPGPDWHVQIHQTGLDLEEGATYTVSFVASSSQESDVTVTATLDEADWHNVGLSKPIRLTPNPRPFSFSFVAKGVRANHGRIAFTLGKARGVVWIGHFKVAPGMAGGAVPAGAELGTIPLPDGGTPNQTRDWTRFLAETETAYAEEMRAYLRQNLGIKANLIDTQIQWGGLTALSREMGSDFADAHMYWEHPSFPRGAWDPKDWTIRNTSMLSAMGEVDSGIFGLAHSRVFGKPFTVSEYNHPAPNDYRVEMMPILASFAAAQDWDGFYTFDYGLTGTGREGNDRIQGFFQTATDPLKAAFFPAAALIFRGGLLLNYRPKVAVTYPAVRPWEAIDSPESSSAGQKSPLAYQIGMEIKPGATAMGISAAALNGPGPKIDFADLTKDGKSPAWSFGAERGSRVAGTVGFVGGHRTTGGDAATFEFPLQGNGFAAAVLSALDGKPLATSSRALLTIANRAENPGMAWNRDRTSVGEGWGKGPVQAEGVECVMTVRTKTLRVAWALDPKGRRKLKLPTTYRDGTLVVRAHPKYKTLWYELSAK